MAYTVEDGSIVAGASSYVTIAYADVYWSDRGSPCEWVDAYKDAKQAALMYATAWLEQNVEWHSCIQDTSQVLGWPRTSYYDSDGRTIGGTGVIPLPVQDATCELALQYIKEDFTSPDNEGIKSEAIGSTSISYSRTYKSFSFIKQMLKGYGSNSSNQANMYRG